MLNRWISTPNRFAEKRFVIPHHGVYGHGTLVAGSRNQAVTSDKRRRGECQAPVGVRRHWATRQDLSAQPRYAATLVGLCGSA